MHDPQNRQYGICLRGKPGWGENLAFHDDVNTFRRFMVRYEMDPQLTLPPGKRRSTLHDLLRKYGPQAQAQTGTRMAALYSLTVSPQCGSNATSAAGYIFDKSQSKVYDKVGFTSAPTARVLNGAGWAWSWGLAIPTSSKRLDAARQFLKWATSRDYVKLVGEKEGWTVIPPGTRKSTYENSEYKKAAPFADFVLRQFGRRPN